MSTRVTRSSVLGKRSHQIPTETSPSATSQCDSAQVPTPDPTPNPKRAKISLLATEGDHNKENIPPFHGEIVNGSPSAARTPRSLRRTSTMMVPPERPQRTPRRYASTSNLQSIPSTPPATPATTFSHLNLSTPPITPPSVLLPIHARARALLRATCNSSSELAGRETERDVIRTFILSFLGPEGGTSHGNSTLYISGSPGTGKTALVNAVLRVTQAEIEENSAKVMSVNCMALNAMDAVWDRLAEDLDDGEKVKKGTRGKKSKETPSEVVKRLLAGRKSKCILILDELDHIASSSQCLSSLFSLAQAHSSHICVIGIANTHTLTSASSTTQSFQSLSGVKTLHFAPYTPQQLLEILLVRLAPLSADGPESAENAKKLLPVPALTLLTKKIASQTGDVRAIFEVLRGAIDLAVTTISSPNPLEIPSPAVTPSHILAALKAYSPAPTTTRSAASSLPTPDTTPAMRKTSDSEIVTKVRDLGLHSRLVLLSLLLACRRVEVGLCLSGSSPSSPSHPSSPRSPTKRSQSMAQVSGSSGKATCMDTMQVYAYYSALLTRGEKSVFASVSRSEFGDLLGMLETVGLVALSSSSMPSTPSKSGRKGNSGRSVSFSVGVGKSTGQEVRFVDGVRLDEVARGLGIPGAGSQAVPAAGIKEEEVRAIWEKERARIAREAKAQAKISFNDGDAFEEAMKD